MTFQDFLLFGGRIERGREHTIADLQPAYLDNCRALLRQLDRGEMVVDVEQEGIPPFSVSLGLPLSLIASLKAESSRQVNSTPGRFLSVFVEEAGPDYPLAISLVLPENIQPEESDENGLSVSRHQVLMITALSIITATETHEMPTADEFFNSTTVRELADKLLGLRPVVVTSYIPEVIFEYEVLTSSAPIMPILSEFIPVFAAAMLTRETRMGDESEQDA